MEPSREERLYDEYLDYLVRGRCEDVDSFVDARGDVDPDLREHLHRMHAAAGLETPRPADEALPFERLGEFRILRRIGDGGMGIVYLAEQESLGRRVALKVIRPEFGGTHPAAARLEREARAVARLNHPNLVSAYAIGFDRGVRYLAMEFVEGRGLDERIADCARAGRHLPIADVLRWIAGVARGLDYAHERGVLHRDVKPSNIRITPDGRALLLDFGLAREVGAERGGLTQAFVGTPYYAAPEQIAADGRACDARSDVYSLGCTLYHCLTNTPPFAGDTMERVCRQILTDDPTPIRRVNPQLSVDVAAVVGMAMEKDPARRFARAGGFADDLEALLELRPVVARAPGPIRRAGKWARRHPGAAAAVATALVAVLVLAALLIAQRVLDRAARRADATAALDEARTSIAAMRGEVHEALALEHRVNELRGHRLNRYFTAEEDEAVDGNQGRIDAMRRERERRFYRVLDLLRRAAELGARAADVRRLRAELYLGKYLEAVALWDDAAQGLYRTLVREHDPDGRLEAQLAGTGRIRIVVEPAAATVHVFRYRQQSEIVPGGDPRSVPVPLGGGRTPAPVGTTVLRVARNDRGYREDDLVLDVAGAPVEGSVFVRRGGAAVRRLDRLVSIDGEPIEDLIDAQSRDAADDAVRAYGFERDGASFVVRGASFAALGIEITDALGIARDGDVEATTWRDGERRTERLPAGLPLRVTATPLFLGASSRAERVPAVLHLEQGSYLFVARAPGHEVLRTIVVVPRNGEGERTFRLLPDGTTPEGFVGVFGWYSDCRPMFIMEREVTMAEYAVFLNDSAVRGAIDEAPSPTRFPRNSINAARGGHLDRATDGRYVVAADQRDLPVYGVSWDDANAYARWRTARARAAGLRHTYRLPTLDEWGLAGGAAGDRRFVFGNAFRPKWVCSCFSRPRPAPEPVLRYPIDEAPTGVRDMAGSVSEWLDAWANRERGYRRFASGSWADGGPAGVFEIYGSNGLPPDKPSDTVGFRLVLDVDGGER